MSLKVSPRIRKNKKEDKKWLEYYKKHSKRIQEMKPTITSTSHNETYDYLHLQLRLKKLQMEEDRFSQVDYQNRKLLERVMKIMGSRQVNNKSPRFKHPGSLNSSLADLEAERIERENKKLHDRIQRVRALSFSAPTVSSLIKETRDRERILLDRYRQQENEALRSRIVEAKPRLSLSPPYTLRHRPPHESFEDKFKAHSESLERENKEGRERIDAIMKSQRIPMSLTQPSPRSNVKLQRSLSEDNKAFLERIERASGTIDFAKWMKEYESQHRPKANDPHKEAEVKKIINENKDIEKRLSKIQGASRKASQGPAVSTNRQAAHQRKFDAWQKSIEKENKVIHDRIKKVKPVMNTRKKLDSSPEPYEDDMHIENKRLKERLTDIKKGKKPVPLSDDPVLNPPRMHCRRRKPETPDFDSENEEKDEEKPPEGKKKEKKKAKNKDYVVPDGYRKKFRKTRKISKASKNSDGESSDSGSETDSD